MHSSSTRLRTAFVPWLAALVIGATAHAGWLIHEMRDHRGSTGDRSFTHTPTREESIAVEVDVDVDVDLDLDLDLDDDDDASDPAPRSLAIHCRHASRERQVARRSAAGSTSELDFWITRIGRYEYEVDTRMLARVETGPSVDASERLGRLLGVMGESVELRNIQRNTALWQLGLRTGDRLLALARPPGSERVELAIARRGRPLVLIYRLV